MARVLGLDIGTNTLRGALVRSGYGRFEVLRYVEASLGGESPASTTSPEQEQADPFARALAALPDAGPPMPPSGADAEQPAIANPLRAAFKDLLRKLGRPPEEVVVAVDGTLVSLRRVTVPAALVKKLDEVLPGELESVVPFELDRAVVDHQPIRREGATLSVLATAAPLEVVRDLLSDLSAAGIHPKEIAVGAAALDGLARAAAPLRSPDPVLLVDLGQKRTDLCLLRDGRCEMARSLSMGTSAFPDRSVPFARLIGQSVAAMRGGETPDPRKVVLVGGGSLLDGIVEWVANITDLPVEVATLPLPIEGERASWVDPRFARALALAARTSSKEKRLDLRRGEFATRKGISNLREHLPLVAGCAAAVFLSFAISTWARYSALMDDQETLVAEMSRQSERLFGKASSSPDEVRKLLEGQRQGDPLPEVDAFGVLSAINMRMPPASESFVHDIERLTIDLGEPGRDGSVQLHGIVGTIEQRDQIADALGRYACFPEVKKLRTTRMVGEERMKYQLEMAVRCGARARPAQTSQSQGEQRGSD
ncbi:MAG: pilus assembly protein PilM [Deltaproteobacteria bacterium]|nr:pilus assembly protein PilM [Deltaproteobacteria bacterium]